MDSSLAVTGLQSDELRGRQHEEEKDQRISNNLASVGKVSIPVHHKDLGGEAVSKVPGHSDSVHFCEFLCYMTTTFVFMCGAKCLHSAPTPTF